ncbi:hypothetical protein ACIP98_41140 [Streptomyces sp. NPDC088354]|uniref:hypothetical protein n=1 Tax=Streptomyces sp. NPDC088354 TaxID=3365856 RepID=UPI00380A201A
MDTHGAPELSILARLRNQVQDLQAQLHAKDDAERALRRELAVATAQRDEASQAARHAAAALEAVRAAFNRDVMAQQLEQAKAHLLDCSSIRPTSPGRRTKRTSGPHSQSSMPGSDSGWQLPSPTRMEIVPGAGDFGECRGGTYRTMILPGIAGRDTLSLFSEATDRVTVGRSATRAERTRLLGG